MTGPALLDYTDVLAKIVQVVTDLITKKHACQTGMDDEDLDDDELDTTELEWIVIDNAMDVISGLAAALGPSFTELWKVFQKQVLTYASSGESIQRQTACGVLAEVITGMGSAVTPYTPTIMQLLLRRLGDEDAQTKSNAAYAIGRLVEKSEDNATITKAYPAIMQKLENMLGTKEANCTDNAAGCISRLIMKHKSKVPIDEVLPALVNTGVLPLKADFQENEPVWKMIVQLYREQDATIQQLTPQLAPIMMNVLGEPDDQLTDETRELVQQLVDHLKKTHG